MAPTHVFHADTRFSGVYAPAYSAIFAAPKNATVGFTPRYSAAVPVTAHPTANRTAARVLRSRRTRGRVRVRLMRASVSGSYSMLSAFAAAEQSVVPVVRKRRVSGDRDGADDARAGEARKAGTG